MASSLGLHMHVHIQACKYAHMFIIMHACTHTPTTYACMNVHTYAFINQILHSWDKMHLSIMHCFYSLLCVLCHHLDEKNLIGLCFQLPFHVLFRLSVMNKTILQNGDVFTPLQFSGRVCVKCFYLLQCLRKFTIEIELVLF